MEHDVAWKKYDEADLEALEQLASEYIDFISDNKTERECAAAAIALAEERGYRPLDEAVREGRALRAGDKVWAQAHGKALILAHLGSAPLAEGFNILGAHIDSPRLDLKQNPFSESNGLAHLDTHYYGGIKNYQWVTLPLALHGVIAKTDGTVVEVNVGEDAGDPVFCVTDLLIHLAGKQMGKKASEVVEGEDLDILIGNRPLVIEKDEADGDAAAGADPAATEADAADRPVYEKLAEKEPVKAFALKLLAEKYGIAEEDFLSAEIEAVPAGRARDLGFDRSMVIGYGQDDRVCAYTSLAAQLALADAALEKTGMCVLVDKEEIGSVGATGMASQFFENTVAEIMELADEGGPLPLRRALVASSMLSSDVSAGFDPAYAAAFEAKNSAYLGRGLVFNKYTGSRGKSGSNDASAEYVARIRRVMGDAGVSFQTAELGKVDVGGGGTIAYIPAKYGMDVIDSGVPVLSMHAPWEVTSKADIYEAFKGYEAFLKNA
ncbi:aminopeptidase [Gordonibacter urolithinfaciens]|uniref:M18 family aminopeptidase n=1 Tax=Gordonibacter urolithinfaciens TaxID=1335613 RepID=A0A423UP64_9ACTN|nr:aminopeptidase [Gordonibacter urolithinfaciens]GKG89197.1 M18 family aminopeptidase [Gordonibacter pamelaeae]MCB6560845.1 aminopeptidase [Gordonibacter urolithinfaciens]MCB7084706.1 aminopeptidase [Gordonibacter urolithinfaciens]ROT92202.1 aminopeptidase [Gordonibacter urolithinfaciens]ROT92804.1 aminopeptidase [Gordonibacter urolithinfaciens]